MRTMEIESSEEETSLIKKKTRKQRKHNRRNAASSTVQYELSCALLSTMLLFILVPYMGVKMYRLKTDLDAALGLGRGDYRPDYLCDDDDHEHSDARHETVTLLDFDRAELSKTIKDARSMLEQYYKDPKTPDAPDNDVLVQSLAVKLGTPEYDAGLDFIATKMARALVWNDNFVVAGMGSSVMAGHDNCNFDSYERQLERQMAPIWDVAKVKFEMRNAGEGGGCGDSHVNQVYCVRNILGDDVDLAHYSWTYFEHGSIPPTHENFIRWLLMMPHSPAALFINTAGETGECVDVSIKSKPQATQYAPYGVQGVCLQSGIIKHGYPGKVWAAVGDGLHNTTRYGQAGQADAARSESLGVVFRNWHPGPLGFQVVADAIAYYYLDAMQLALRKIAEVVPENAVVGPLSEHHKQLEQLYPKKMRLLDLSKLPAPLDCDPRLCNGVEPPGCKNFEAPTYGRGQVSVLPGSDDFNPFQSKYTGKDKGWTSIKGPPSTLIPRQEQDDPRCAHLDACNGYKAEGGSAAGWITFRLPRLIKGIIIVCSYGKEGGQAMLDAKVKFQMEDVVLPPGEIGPEKKCLTVMKEFPAQMNDAQGHLNLGVHVESTSDIMITHVITL